jgi:hypothetical protein
MWRYLPGELDGLSVTWTTHDELSYTCYVDSAHPFELSITAPDILELSTLRPSMGETPYCKFQRFVDDPEEIPIYLDQFQRRHRMLGSSATNYQSEPFTEYEAPDTLV